MPETIWLQAKQILMQKLSAAAYATWIAPLRMVGLEAGTLTLEAESSFAAQQTAKISAGMLRDALREITGKNHHIKFINNININSSENIKSNQNSSRSPQTENINSINRERDYSGLYAKVHSDKALLDLQGWGVDPQFIYAAVRDLGEAKVKEIHARLSRLADSYFRQNYGPINKQRGRLFNNEVTKLKRPKMMA